MRRDSNTGGGGTVASGHREEQPRTGRVAATDGGLDAESKEDDRARKLQPPPLMADQRRAKEGTVDGSRAVAARGKDGDLTVEAHGGKRDSGRLNAVGGWRQGRKERWLGGEGAVEQGLLRAQRLGLCDGGCGVPRRWPRSLQGATREQRHGRDGWPPVVPPLSFSPVLFFIFLVSLLQQLLRFFGSIALQGIEAKGQVVVTGAVGSQWCYGDGDIHCL
ncbi:Brefeldin A resistance protein [Sesbania bispinosa]|nr:Brefeldin A resistance protein [Sesbania bispinosa]